MILRRAAVLFLAGAVHGTPALASPKLEQLSDCAVRLDRSLAEMESRDLMKEELATGLMWLRLDAQKALEADDAEGCVSRVEAVERILGIEPQAE